MNRGVRGSQRLRVSVEGAASQAGADSDGLEGAMAVGRVFGLGYCRLSEQIRVKANQSGDRDQAVLAGLRVTLNMRVEAGLGHPSRPILRGSHTHVSLTSSYPVKRKTSPLRAQSRPAVASGSRHMGPRAAEPLCSDLLCRQHSTLQSQ